MIFIHAGRELDSPFEPDEEKQLLGILNGIRSTAVEDFVDGKQIDDVEPLIKELAEYAHHDVIQKLVAYVDAESVRMENTD